MNPRRRTAPIVKPAISAVVAPFGDASDEFPEGCAVATLLEESHVTEGPCKLVDL